MGHIDLNQSFAELYRSLLKASGGGTLPETAVSLAESEYSQDHLDCLLYPERHPVVWKLSDCACNQDCRMECANVCEFGAIAMTPHGLEINDEKCTGCGACIEYCKENNLIESKDSIAVLNVLQEKKQLAYALVAPAFLGQFGNEVTPGKLRSCLKSIGFDGMLEVAVFADVLTLKESFDFLENIRTESDYQLTSCCCPMWIAMIRKVYSKLIPHVPAAVSPMIAGGRTIKHLYPDAITVFIGPCIAKKAEAREDDIKDAIDYVLTFQEMQEIFDARGLNPELMEDNEKEISSRAGRIYARTGGVSEAVERTVERINPNHSVLVKTQQADGVKACKEMLNQILEGHINANFYEGMGCAGGCVGGPKAIIDKSEAANNVDDYGNKAIYNTPIDNPYVIELMKRLGFETPESLVKNSLIFTRKFYL